ncbi:MAG: hypothetical protein AB7U95_40110, partial [Reyranella sp.]
MAATDDQTLATGFAAGAAFGLFLKKFRIIYDHEPQAEAADTSKNPGFAVTAPAKQTYVARKGSHTVWFE